MIIDNSNIMLSSTHLLMQAYQKSEGLKILTSTAKPHEQMHAESIADKVSISEKATKHIEKELDKVIKHLEEDLDSEKIKKSNIGNHKDTKWGFVKKLVESITGKKIKLKELEDWLENYVKHDDHDTFDHDGKIYSKQHKPENQRWYIAYNMYESFYEYEEMSFTTGGIIKTIDGREINFSLDLMMSRQFITENSLSLVATGVSTNNIVINFDGTTSELSNARFNFEIESEENNETLSYLALGSGLLTLDLDNNGEIDSLNELFGPNTGNGFAELAKYDEDGNNWIDENDSIYNKLNIWTTDSEGNAVLNSLKDKNVGAIYLANVSSEFAIKDSANSLIGQIDRSGIYLNEGGTVGTVQQLSIIV